jgi:hypothetical protein
VLREIKKIFSKVGMFLAHHKAVLSRPQLTTDRPQISHKNTIKKTHFSQNPLQKRPKSTKKVPAKAGTF